MKYSHESPFYHLTEMRGEGPSYPSYYFRFKIKNEGKLQAEQCEAVLEKIWEKDAGGNLIEDKIFSPTSLTWAGTKETHLTIQPEREIFCDIGHIHHPTREERSVYYSNDRSLDANDRLYGFRHTGFSNTITNSFSSPGANPSNLSKEDNRKSNFFFEFSQRFHAYRDCLLPGKYQIEIAVYSANSKRTSKRFKIYWSGNWKDDESEMLSEVVIS